MAKFERLQTTSCAHIHKYTVSGMVCMYVCVCGLSCKGAENTFLLLLVVETIL